MVALFCHSSPVNQFGSVCEKWVMYCPFFAALIFRASAAYSSQVVGAVRPSLSNMSLR